MVQNASARIPACPRPRQRCDLDDVGPGQASRDTRALWARQSGAESAWHTGGDACPRRRLRFRRTLYRGISVKIIDCEQYSEAWYEARIGLPTASQFHRIVTPTGKPSRQATAYMYRLITETLLHESMDDYLGSVQWAERGKLIEGDAAAQFEFTHNVELKPVGLVTTDDGAMACSPDRLIAGHHAAVEIKCPAPWTHLGYLLDGPGDDYRPQ